MDRDACKAAIITVNFFTCREEEFWVLNEVAAECADDHARHTLQEGKQAECPEEHIDTRHQAFDEQLERRQDTRHGHLGISVPSILSIADSQVLMLVSKSRGFNLRESYNPQSQVTT